MKTIEDFFEEVQRLKSHLEGKSSKTVHTNEYEESCRELYADWQEVKISLKPLADQQIIDSMDKEFTALLRESRKSRSSVQTSVGHLREVEDEYIEHVYPEVSHRDISAGFIHSLAADLEQIRTDKYHDYMEEALQCVQAGAYRGAVVLGWQAAMYALYKGLEAHNDPIHVAYQKQFQTTPNFNITDFWSFQKMNDRDILILAENVGLIDKSLKDILDKERDIRNKAAHPGQFDVGPNGTKAMLEKMVQLLVSLDL
ncbi:hypothetical protein [Haloplanus sp. C73]|uniref:hypothetical protein n=1 Tax=Haloplanus sp. C73 TaxID=3421641 RepID=UPI003EBDC13E